jgi:hypothetical protein
MVNVDFIAYALVVWILQLFVDTQLFTVLSDSHLSSFENGYS